MFAFAAPLCYDLAYSGIQVYIAFGSKLTKAKQFAFASQLSQRVQAQGRLVNVSHLNLKEMSARILAIREIIQKRTMILFSAHFFISKWWCIGAIRKTFFPRSLKLPT